MALPTSGTMAVDWEQRVDFDRLRTQRLARAKGLLAKSDMGALLCFDMNNVRYLTATHIGTWAQDKANRFTLLPQNDEPILVGFWIGGAASPTSLSVAWRALAGRHFWCCAGRCHRRWVARRTSRTKSGLSLRLAV